MTEKIIGKKLYNEHFLEVLKTALKMGGYSFNKKYYMPPFYGKKNWVTRIFKQTTHH